MKPTIAQQLGIKKFPFRIRNQQDKLIYKEWHNSYWERWDRNDKGNIIYYEDSNGFWSRREYDKQENIIYYEDSDGLIKDNRPKEQQSSTKI
jgi:hypothetical protein